MNECWGMYSESYDRTIDVHITHVREKLNDNELVLLSFFIEYKIISFVS